MQRYSRQREAILTFLKERHDHPTAEVIYTNLKDRFPALSPGTVYRNLNLLAENGEISRLSVGDEADHYDGNPVPHYHFYCRKCGSLSDMPMPLLSDLNTLAGHLFSGEIQGHTVYFYGICSNCKKTESS